MPLPSSTPLVPPPFTAAQWANILGCVAFCAAVGFAESEAEAENEGGDGATSADNGDSKNDLPIHPIILNASNAAADIRAALGKECYDYVTEMIEDWTRTRDRATHP